MRRLLLVDVLVAVALTAAGAAGSARSAQERWVITDLGAPFGKWIEPVAINERGAAIFSSRTANNRHRYGFLWANGKATDLGALDSTRRNTFPSGINDRGQVVGTGSRSAWSNIQSDRAFLWEGGKMKDLGTLGAVYSSSAAVAINNRGQVIGESFSPSTGTHHAFLWQNGKMLDIGTCAWHGRSVTAKAINNLGQIVGDCSVPGTAAAPGRHTHAYLWEDGKMTDLGTLGGVNSHAGAVNDRGQVVGTSSTKDKQGHGFLWEDGKMIDLGPGSASAITARGQIVFNGSLWQNGTVVKLPSDWTAMNERGQFIGEVEVVPSGKSEEAGRTIPFVWENGHKTVLPTLGGQWTWTSAINNRGEIIGTSEMKNGQAHAVLWTLRPGS